MPREESFIREGQERLRTRRPEVDTPIRRLDMIPKPTVTEAVVRVRKQDRTNIGSNLRDLADALSSFGGTLQQIDAKRKKELEKACGKLKKEGKKKKKEQIDLEQLESAAFGGGTINITDSGTFGSETLDLALMSKADKDGNIPSAPARISVEGGDIDVNSLVQREAEEEAALDDTYEALREADARGELTGRIDPRLLKSAQLIESNGALQDVSAKYLKDVEDINDPDFDPTDILNGFRSESLNIYNTIDNAKSRKKYAGKHLRARVKLEAAINKRKTLLVNNHNKEVILDSSIRQLRSASDAINSTGVDAMDDLPNAINDTLMKFRKVGLGNKGLANYYVGQVLRPYLGEIIDEDPGTAAVMIDRIGKTKMGNSGAILGNTSAFINLKNSLFPKLDKKLRAQDGSDDDLRKELIEDLDRAVYFGDLDLAEEHLKTLELDPNVNFNQLRAKKSKIIREKVFREKLDQGVKSHIQSLGGTLLSDVAKAAGEGYDEVTTEIAYAKAAKKVSEIAKEYREKFKEVLFDQTEIGAQAKDYDPIKETVKLMEPAIKEYQKALVDTFREEAAKIQRQSRNDPDTLFNR